MDEVVTSKARWTVSARPSGEVLAVSVEGRGVRLGWLGTPPGLGPSEVEEWLAELLTMAGQSDATASDGPGGAPAGEFLPDLLHQVLTGLLVYEAELWGGGPSPCALAVMEMEGWLAVGWVGPGRLELSRAGRTFEPTWMFVRDAQGRDARAFVTEAGQPLLARAWWPGASRAVDAAESTIEAEWPGFAAGMPVEATRYGRDGDTGRAEDGNAAPARSATTPDEIMPAAHRSGGPRGFWRFRGWMDRLAGARAPEGARRDAAVEPEPIAHDVPGVPDLIPAPESSDAAPLQAETTAEPAIRSGTRGRDALESLVDAEPACDAVPGTAGVEVEGMSPAAARPSRVAEASPEVEAQEEAAAVGRTPAPAMAGEETGEHVEEIDPYDLGPISEFAPAPADVPVPMEEEAEIARAPVPESSSPEADVASAPAAESVVPATDAASAPAAESVVPAAEAASAPAVEPVLPDAGVAPEPVLESVSRDVGAAPASVPESGSPPAEMAADPASIGARAVARRPAWPAPEELAPAVGRPRWHRGWLIAAVVTALFGAGWLLGRVDVATGFRRLTSSLEAVGFGPARYQVTVTSRPSGAWIAVDGVDQALRTPAVLALKPGAHAIVLSISGAGGSSHSVSGKRGQRLALDVELWGALRVTVPPGTAPVAVAVDGLPRGYAPLDVDRLQPGIHRLQFTGPGMAPWEQTVEVQADRTAEVAAQPVTSPGTGVLEVSATLAEESGSQPLTGAGVWIDGERRGSTPLKLELPRGPHSIRVRYHEEDGPIQVIELPGGNVRFATVELGQEGGIPRLEASLPARVPLDRPTVLSASLDRAREADVREMWLHVRTPEGAWRRYPMTVMRAPGGVAGVAVFPIVLFDARGRTGWYVSATTPMGDEYFTEMQSAQASARP